MKTRLLHYYINSYDLGEPVDYEMEQNRAKIYEEQLNRLDDDDITSLYETLKYEGEL